MGIGIIFFVLLKCSFWVSEDTIGIEFKSCCGIKSQNFLWLQLQLRFHQKFSLSTIQALFISAFKCSSLPLTTNPVLYINSSFQSSSFNMVYNLHTLILVAWHMCDVGVYRNRVDTSDYNPCSKKSASNRLLGIHSWTHLFSVFSTW